MGVTGAGCGCAKGCCDDDAAGCSDAISAMGESVCLVVGNGRCGVGRPAMGPRPWTDEPGQDRVSQSDYRIAATTRAAISMSDEQGKSCRAVGRHSVAGSRLWREV